MLINCVAYQDGKRLGDIPKEEISEYVKRADCFVWVAIKGNFPQRDRFGNAGAAFERTGRDNQQGAGEDP